MIFVVAHRPARRRDLSPAPRSAESRSARRGNTSDPSKVQRLKLGAEIVRRRLEGPSTLDVRVARRSDGHFDRLDHLSRQPDDSIGGVDQTAR